MVTYPRFLILVFFGSIMFMYAIAFLRCSISFCYLSLPDFDSTHESVSTLNPWISDNPEYWNTEVRPKFLPIRRIKRWSFSIHELLKDPIGLDEFQRWLEKEFSAENLRFWQACQVSFVILFP